MLCYSNDLKAPQFVYLSELSFSSAHFAALVFSTLVLIWEVQFHLAVANQLLYVMEFTGSRTCLPLFPGPLGTKRLYHI